MKKAYKRTESGEIKEIYKTLSSRNKAFITKFLALKKGSVTENHLNHLHTSLTKIANLLEKDFDKVKREEMKIANGLMIASIRKIKMSPRTIQDDISAIKELYKELWGEGEEYPKVVRGLERPKSRGNLNLPDTMLKDEDIYKLIKACRNPRDKCLIGIMGLDGALRKVEAVRIKIADIKKDEHGYYIVIKTAKESGSKEKRVVRIIKSEPYLVRWLNDYPKEKRPRDNLFVTLDGKNDMTTAAVDFLFKSLKKKVNFYVSPKLLRHSLLTRMAKDPNVSLSVLGKFSGHTAMSRVLNEYLHHGDEDVKDMQLQYNGIIKREEMKKEEIRPIECPKCKKSNDYDNEVCDFCGMALSQKLQVESFEKVEDLKQEMTEMIKQQMRSQLKDALREEMLDKIRDASYQDMPNSKEVKP